MRISDWSSDVCSSDLIAENQRSFPVAIDARAIAGVRRIVLLADLNPIPIAIDYRPTDGEAYLATRIKLDQRTPVRGAVQLASGEWLVRSEEHTSELQSLMRISYAVFCLKHNNITSCQPYH